MLDLTIQIYINCNLFAKLIFNRRPVPSLMPLNHLCQIVSHVYTTAMRLNFTDKMLIIYFDLAYTLLLILPHCRYPKAASQLGTLQCNMQHAVFSCHGIAASPHCVILKCVQLCIKGSFKEQWEVGNICLLDFGLPHSIIMVWH